MRVDGSVVRLTVWLCGTGFDELRMSYCHELRARLVQRGLDTQVVDLDGGGVAERVTDDPGTACTLVLAGRAEPPEPGCDVEGTTVLQVCFHAEACGGGVEVLPGREPVAVGVDRTLAALEQAGVLDVVAQNVRRDEELMIHRLYDLGYL